MERSKYIAQKVREVLLNGRWIANTNFKEQIESVTWKQATQKIGTLNTIAALTFHINYYLAGILHVLEGGELEIRDKFSYDLPRIKTESDWNNLVREFLANAEKFVAQVEKIPDYALDQAFVNEKYGTYLRNIEGLIEHCYYHLGQILIIKKMVIEPHN